MKKILILFLFIIPFISFSQGTKVITAYKFKGDTLEGRSKRWRVIDTLIFNLTNDKLYSIRLHEDTLFLNNDTLVSSGGTPSTNYWTKTGDSIYNNISNGINLKGKVRLDSMIGIGIRMVVTDQNGMLRPYPLPGKIISGNGLAYREAVWINDSTHLYGIIYDDMVDSISVMGKMSVLDTTVIKSDLSVWGNMDIRASTGLVTDSVLVLDGTRIKKVSSGSYGNSYWSKTTSKLYPTTSTDTVDMDIVQTPYIRHNDTIEIYSVYGQYNSYFIMNPYEGYVMLQNTDTPSGYREELKMMGDSLEIYFLLSPHSGKTVTYNFDTTGIFHNKYGNTDTTRIKEFGNEEHVWEGHFNTIYARALVNQGTPDSLLSIDNGQIKRTAVSDVGAIYRYSAYSSGSNNVEVLATVNNITATIENTNELTFTIPAGARIISAKVRISSVSTLKVSMGTNDMGNTTLADKWMPLCQAWREDTGQQLIGMTILLGKVTSGPIGSDIDGFTVNGLINTTICHVRISF